MSAFATSWVNVPDGSDFPIQNLPYGVFSNESGTRCGIGIGTSILDLAAAERVGVFAHTDLDAKTFFSDTLNDFIAQGRGVWTQVRDAVSAFLDSANTAAAVLAEEHQLIVSMPVTMKLPVQVGDYVDFYSSEQHATNLGKMFRPDGEALLPNWKQLPVGYHGRAGTVVVSGTDIARPSGQRLVDGVPVFEPSVRLDIELEVGFITANANVLGTPVDIGAAEDAIFGICLVNDWSARDIQAWEYVPLGPFLGKSFATTISPWIVPLDALEPFRVQLAAQDPAPLPYLRDDLRRGIGIDLSVGYTPHNSSAETVVTRTSFTNMYWTMAQQLAHATVNGATARAGDLFASGTVSGEGAHECGSLIEMTWNGTEPMTLDDGSVRMFLEDGDSVVIRGRCSANGAVPIGFGDCVGTVVNRTG